MFVTQQQITNTDGVKIFKGGDASEVPSFCTQGIGVSRRSCDLPPVKQLAGATRSRLLWELGPGSHSAAALSSCGLSKPSCFLCLWFFLSRAGLDQTYSRCLLAMIWDSEATQVCDLSRSQASAPWYGLFSAAWHVLCRVFPLGL